MVSIYHKISREAPKSNATVHCAWAQVCRAVYQVSGQCKNMLYYIFKVVVSKPNEPNET